MHLESQKIYVTYFIGDIHVIAVVWNWNHTISEICLYSWQKQKLKGSTWEPVPVEESNWMKLNFSTEISLF